MSDSASNPTEVTLPYPYADQAEPLPDGGFSLPTLASPTTALAELDKIVSGMEDYVYPRQSRPQERCVYVHDGDPDCLIGRLLVRAGVPLSWLASQESLDSSPTAQQLGVKLNLPLSVVQLLDTVQGEQDGGSPWGVAVERGRQRVAVTTA